MVPAVHIDKYHPLKLAHQLSDENIEATKILKKTLKPQPKVTGPLAGEQVSFLDKGEIRTRAPFETTDSHREED